MSAVADKVGIVIPKSLIGDRSQTTQSGHSATLIHMRDDQGRDALALLIGAFVFAAFTLYAA